MSVGTVDLMASTCSVLHGVAHARSLPTSACPAGGLLCGAGDEDVDRARAMSSSGESIPIGRGTAPRAKGRCLHEELTAPRTRGRSKAPSSPLRRSRSQQRTAPSSRQRRGAPRDTFPSILSVAPIWLCGMTPESGGSLKISTCRPSAVGREGPFEVDLEILVTSAGSSCW
jgi:hypothetical protein